MNEVKEKKEIKAKPGKYLTFEVGGEEYGIEILKVREIIGLQEITRVPNMPEFIKGVINLRGKVIPVIDMRVRFGLGNVEYTDKTCIIVVEIEESGSNKIIPMGIIVDSVSDVVNIEEEDIEPTPSFGVKLNTEYILGMGKVKGGVKTLLDIDKLLTAEEIVLLKQ